MYPANRGQPIPPPFDEWTILNKDGSSSLATTPRHGIGEKIEPNKKTQSNPETELASTPSTVPLQTLLPAPVVLNVEMPQLSNHTVSIEPAKELTTASSTGNPSILDLFLRYCCCAQINLEKES